ncbi:MAG: response regulator [Bacillota bacterium]|nr:response regulator [Bacillota bacterium]
MTEMTAQTVRILAIDDNPDILYTLEQICRFQGWIPLMANGYDEAVEVIRSQTPDLVLVDYHMPGRDGISTVSELRKILPDVPIVVLTIEESDRVVQRFTEAGADDYALKPIKAIDLISRIKVHLQLAAKRQPDRTPGKDDRAVRSEAAGGGQNDNGEKISRQDVFREKGISEVTLTKIEKALKGEAAFRDIDEIETATTIKKKTLYRYLQFLLKEGRIEQDYSYGEMGRPRTLYRWKTEQ